MIKKLWTGKKYGNIKCFILVLDSETIKVISSMIEIVELMENRIINIEKLDRIRKPFPKMHAIYFITPTANSVEMLCNDFKDKNKPQYVAAHVFFSN
jgi:hypothetical protein